MAMITIFPPAHTQHHPPHEFLNGALVTAHESPSRANIIHDALQHAALGPILPPRAFGLDPIRAIHDAQYLEFLEHTYERWVAAGGSPAAVLPDTLAVRRMDRRSTSPLALPGYYASDLGAPIVAGTYQAARDSADAALTAADLLLNGEHAVYALCRPPGHHAGSDMYGGYCYLNNAAIAAEYLGVRSQESGVSKASGDTQPTRHRIAILDIDYHHGNGTQQIFYERDDVLTVSIHADPLREYPYFSGYADQRGAGAGLGYNLNIPLEAGITTERYLTILDQTLVTITDFNPQFLVLSAGFDTFAGDPVAENGGGFALTAEAYPQIGRRIAALGIPTLIVQEGGYAVAALGENVIGLLRGFMGT
jgi:acetoin utilization deacetylase AcuC-like enzyme